MPRLWIVAILALLIVAAVFSVTRLRFSANIYDLLPADLPEVQGMDLLNRHFSQDSVLTVTLEAANSPETEAAAASLADALVARQDLVARVARELPPEDMARESAELIAWLWFNGEPAALQSLAEGLGEDSSKDVINESLTAVQEGFLDEKTVIQSYDPLGLLRLPGALDSLGGPASNPMSSVDGTFRVLYVTGAGPPFRDYRHAAEWIEELRHVIASWQSDHPDFESVQIGLTGTPAFMATIGIRMERDLSGSLILTTILIGVLFAIMHRRLQPLLWLVAMMLLVLCATLNLGSLLVGNLSVMSAGFAAILMGLVVDYGVVLYREASADRSTTRLRRRVGPGILWAAATTAAVFLSLNLSALPGLAQLGNLVALGVALGAAAMLIAFAPVAARVSAHAASPSGSPPVRPGFCLTVALVVPVAAVISVAARGAPSLDPEFRPFRISESPAFQAWNHMRSRLSDRQSVTPLVVIGGSNKSLQTNAARAHDRLENAQVAGLVTDFSLPLALIPNRAKQEANSPAIRRLLLERDRLISEIEAAGFSEQGTQLTREMFGQWSSLLTTLPARAGPIKPSGPLAEFALARVLSHSEDGGQYALLGTVQPAQKTSRAWIEAICDETTAVASLGALGTALNERIKADLLRVFLPMMAILTVMLILVFRSWRDVLLSVFSLVFAAAAILLVTLWSPLGWNAFNVCAIPILFGTGLDYGIHMIFTLRRNGGHLAQARETIGKALLFCGGSTAIGFGTLAFASARGLASLGQICAAGILINMLVAVYLLPRWWKWLHRGSTFQAPGQPPPTR